MVYRPEAAALVCFMYWKNSGSSSEPPNVHSELVAESSSPPSTVPLLNSRSGSIGTDA